MITIASLSGLFAPPSYGDPNGTTAMAKTVGVTAALGAQMILDGALKRTGVAIPTTPDIYGPCLEALGREGLHFKEERHFLE